MQTIRKLKPKSETSHVFTVVAPRLDPQPRRLKFLVLNLIVITTLVCDIRNHEDYKID